jgi:hypothetical protein
MKIPPRFSNPLPPENFAGKMEPHKNVKFNERTDIALSPASQPELKVPELKVTRPKLKVTRTNGIHLSFVCLV